MDLRPHHLLCTQGYGGKGYSEEFVENMDRLTKQLRGDTPVKVRVRFSTDDLCSHCPNKQGGNLCSTDEKVQRFDRKTAEYFQLEKKRIYISGSDRKNSEADYAGNAGGYLPGLLLVSGQCMQRKDFKILPDEERK